MKADVRRDFVRRFGEIQIREFYASTEGKFALLMHSTHHGRDRCFFPYAVIKDKGEPLRDSYGFFIEVEKGEPGLLVTEITAKAPFIGYVRDLNQTEKKKLHNVFKKGDLYFNTGDLLRIDEDNFMYFHDRVGDTFRWKGENVATAEVADILVLTDCVKEANVYGVKVPGEPGLLVTEITAKAPFTGYVRDMKQTEKKKLHNVFKKGDLYFNTGDLHTKGEGDLKS